MKATNACPTPGCGNRKRGDVPFCGTCWRALPKHLRVKVRNARVNGQTRALRRLAKKAARWREARFHAARMGDTAQRP